MEPPTAASAGICPPDVSSVEMISSPPSAAAISAVPAAAASTDLSDAVKTAEKSEDMKDRLNPSKQPPPVPQHGPSVLRTYAMSTTFASIPTHLAAHPEEARTLGNLNETCLHWSCFHRGPAYAILPIAASYPEACGIVGACGRSPLHIVCAGGGRGTVNALEETVDLVEKLAGYNAIMSVLVSVEDGETPLSGLWGVYERQCPDVLGDVLAKLAVGDGDEGSISVKGSFDEEFWLMIRRALGERRAKKAREVKSGESCAAMAPPPPQPQMMLPAWMRALEALEAGGDVQNVLAEPVTATNRKRDRSARSVSPPPRADVAGKHVRIQLPTVLPALDVTQGPRQCPYKNNPPSVDPVEMPPTFKSAAEEIDENIRVLIVQIEKMLMLIHAADYVFATYPQALPKPLATESPIGGHFIFHPLPEKTPELDGKAYGPYWIDDDWDPLQGAIRVYERLGELGVPESFLRLLVGLYSDPVKEGKTDVPPFSPATQQQPLHLALSSRSTPTSIIDCIIKLSPPALEPKCAPRCSLHVAISNGRTWSEGVLAVLNANPLALSVRDAETGLYPFMLAAACDSAGHESPPRMKLGQGKHMVPVTPEKVQNDVKLEERELRVLDTVFKLLLECPVLVNSNQVARATH